MIISKSDLRTKIETHFNLVEFKSLCFDLSDFDVKYDNLAGETLTTKVEELIGFLDRRGELPQLLFICSNLRPKVTWYETPSGLEEWIIGKWHGEWKWKGKHRSAELSFPTIIDEESLLRIEYNKSGTRTIVEQTLSVVIDKYNVELNGTGYRFIEQGIAVGYHLDKFYLVYTLNENVLKGIKVDKRGIEVPVVFKRLN